MGEGKRADLRVRFDAPAGFVTPTAAGVSKTEGHETQSGGLQ